MEEHRPPKVYTPCAHESFTNMYGLQEPSKNLTHDGVWCPFCCPKCERLDYLLDGCQPPFTQYRNAVRLHMREDHQGSNKKSHEGNGKPKGAFAFTLTKSPTDDLTEEDMIGAVRKLMGYTSYNVVKYAWYLEYTDVETKKHPHIHGMYELDTQGRIENKFFKRAWNIWDPKTRMGAGFRGGYHRPVKSEEGYKDYISEDGGLHDSLNV